MNNQAAKPPCSIFLRPPRLDVNPWVAHLLDPCQQNFFQRIIFFPRQLGGSAGTRQRWPAREDSAEKALISQNFRVDVFFQANSCYHAADERLRLQERKPPGIFPGQTKPGAAAPLSPNQPPGNKDMPANRQPLSDIKVLDLSRVLAGPYCSMMLGDLGAEVIKVELPQAGDDTRHWASRRICGQVRQQ